MARILTVEVDKNEQEPFTFPAQVVWTKPNGNRELCKIKTVRKRLLAGDYRLASHPTACGIERKKGIDELCSNLLTRDRARFNDAWRRFYSTFQHPVLVIEQCLSSAGSLNFSPPGLTASDAMASFWRLLLSTPKPVTVIWAGRAASPTTRLNLGEQLIRMMLALSAGDH